MGALLEHDALVVGERIVAFDLVVHPGVDGVVVVARGTEDLESKLLARLERRGTVVGAHLVEDRVVARGVGHDRDRCVVLGRRAEHGGASDVDVLDRVLVLDARPVDGRLEGVQVDDDHVDHADAVVGGVFHVAFEVAACEQAAVDLGVQRLHAPVHHLGESRVVLNRGDGNASILEHLSRSARADDLHAKLVDECACKILDSAFIGKRDNRTLDLLICHRSPFPYHVN